MLKKTPLTDDRTMEYALNAALALHQVGRITEAQQIYRQIIDLQPNNAGALHLLGLCHHQLGEHATAIALIRQSIALAPNNYIAQNNLGATLLAARKPEAALDAFEQALKLNPEYHEAWNNRGNALAELYRLDKALASYDRAAQLGNQSPVLHFNRANLLQLLGRLDESSDEYRKALALAPQSKEAWHNFGALQEKLGHLDDAQLSYERVLQLDPTACYTRGRLLYTRLLRNDWRGLDALTNQLIEATEAGKLATEPYLLLTIQTSLEQQLLCAHAYAADKYPDSVKGLMGRPQRSHKRLRIGYFSADFHNHATAHLIAEVFEQHDRSRFELVGFSFGPPSNDDWRLRLTKSFDQFLDVRSLSDREIAEQVIAQEIDIAVDLKGYTQNARTGIFTWRPAPIQVNFLGYPGTMGANYFDYLIADHVVISPEQVPFYSEKIAYLPDTYQPNDSTKRIDPVCPSRSVLGLPDEGFVFCCFNNSYKITPDVFDVWMRLLRQVEGSVLWLLDSNAAAMANLRREAISRNIAPERLVFAPRRPLSEHLARHRAADLFLDTFHYNAHTTASDALWAGLPVLTRAGQTFSSRVAASLLKAVGLPELITTTAEAYEALALGLAHDAQRLAGLHERLATNRLTWPLFDSARYTRNLETAYTKMWERHLAGLPPDHIVVNQTTVLNG